MNKYFKILIFGLLLFIGCEDDKESSSTDNNGGNGQSETVYGCTDPDATNYNPDATEDDGSCTYKEDAPGFGIFAAIISCLIIAFRRKRNS